jgi:hypothetical protein
MVVREGGPDGPASRNTCGSFSVFAFFPELPLLPHKAAGGEILSFALPPSELPLLPHKAAGGEILSFALPPSELPLLPHKAAGGASLFH